jgi:hypothetical protein
LNLAILSGFAGVEVFCANCKLIVPAVVAVILPCNDTWNGILASVKMLAFTSVPGVAVQFVVEACGKAAPSGALPDIVTLQVAPALPNIAIFKSGPALAVLEISKS